METDNVARRSFKHVSPRYHTSSHRPSYWPAGVYLSLNRPGPVPMPLPRFESCLLEDLAARIVERQQRCTPPSGV